MTKVTPQEISQIEEQGVALYRRSSKQLDNLEQFYFDKLQAIKKEQPELAPYIDTSIKSVRKRSESQILSIINRGRSRIKTEALIEFKDNVPQSVESNIVSWGAVSSIITINRVLYKVFTKMFGLRMGLALTVIIVGPLTEEIFKKLAIEAEGGSLRTVKRFMWVEFMMFMAMIGGVSVSYFKNKQPIMAAAIVLIAIVARLTVNQVHMTTAKAYSSEYEKTQGISWKTLGKGVLFHSVYNTATMLLSMFSYLASAFADVFELSLGSVSNLSAATLLKRFFSTKQVESIELRDYILHS